MEGVLDQAWLREVLLCKMMLHFLRQMLENQLIGEILPA
jgi:hypothetical protein